MPTVPQTLAAAVLLAAAIAAASASAAPSEESLTVGVDNLVDGDAQLSGPDERSPARTRRDGGGGDVARCRSMPKAPRPTPRST